MAVAETAASVASTVACTALSERALLCELVGYADAAGGAATLAPMSTATCDARARVVSAHLSIVVSTLGNHEGLRRVLEGYADQTESGFELLICTDFAEPDPDAVTAAIGERPYPVRTVPAELPGASASRNAGWRAASAPLVAFADNDTIPEPDWVAEHLAWHREHPAEEVGVLGLVRWADEVEVTPFMRWLDHGIQFDYPHIEGIDAGWERLYSANVSFKRAFVERVGGFDEVHFPYGYEDLDLGYRLNQIGLRLLFNRTAVAQHLRAFDLDFYERRVRRIAFAEREFVRLHPDVEPFFFNLFSAAIDASPASGRGRALIGRVARSTPLLGARAWASVDLYYRQQLAPAFLEAWEQAGTHAPDGPPTN
jgi:GT2 family glycosyltransferase